MYLSEIKGQMCIFKCTNINSMFEPAGEDRSSSAWTHSSRAPTHLKIFMLLQASIRCFSTIMNNLRENLLCSLACFNRGTSRLHSIQLLFGSFHLCGAEAGLYLHPLHLLLKAFLPISWSPAVRNLFQTCFFLWASWLSSHLCRPSWIPTLCFRHQDAYGKGGCEFGLKRSSPTRAWNPTAASRTRRLSHE